eukprot:GHVQ01024259.1.p1 GENE.GHVQ01024259.1~~GHVQ01024259.1.p1  ORF type:complete len:175 (+),score=26.84 GHVQ01024259.1:640-1164(+)
MAHAVYLFRILQIEREVSTAEGHAVHVNVDLWDVSGSSKYSHCWSAIQKDAVGVLFVYCPNSPSQISQVQQWYELFALSMRIQRKQFMTIGFFDKTDEASEYAANHRKESGDTFKVQSQLPSGLPPVTCVVAADNLPALRPAFDDFVAALRPFATDLQQPSDVNSHPSTAHNIS